LYGRFNISAAVIQIANVIKIKNIIFFPRDLEGPRISPGTTLLYALLESVVDTIGGGCFIV